eukprot:g544.t1
MIVFELLLENLEVYDNLILPSIDALKYVSAFGQDCLGYALLLRMSDPSRNKLSEDGINECKWFQNLCHFAGCFYRKYTRRGNPEEGTDGQIQAQAGGKALPRNRDQEEGRIKKSSMALMEALEQQELILPFYVLMAQQHRAVVT